MPRFIPAPAPHAAIDFSALRVSLANALHRMADALTRRAAA
ncbi:hypothetical protein [Paracoccus albicereus]|nr:hypothetical protein [Paracoccus albicereus]